jgi:hypothetical protein
MRKPLVLPENHHMPNTQHTPGPWRVVADGQYIQADRRHAVNPQQQHDLDICHVHAIEFYAGEAQSNARLIAAAPELLAALREIADSAPALPKKAKSCTQLRAIARAAIAKATGGES